MSSQELFEYLYPVGSYFLSKNRNMIFPAGKWIYVGITILGEGAYAFRRVK